MSNPNPRAIAELPRSAPASLALPEVTALPARPGNPLATWRVGSARYGIYVHARALRPDAPEKLRARVLDVMIATACGRCPRCRGRTDWLSQHPRPVERDERGREIWRLSRRGGHIRHLDDCSIRDWPTEDDTRWFVSLTRGREPI